MKLTLQQPAITATISQSLRRDLKRIDAAINQFPPDLSNLCKLSRGHNDLQQFAETLSTQLTQSHARMLP